MIICILYYSSLIHLILSVMFLCLLRLCRVSRCLLFSMLVVSSPHVCCSFLATLVRLCVSVVYLGRRFRCSLFPLSLCFLKLFCLSKTRTSLILSFSLLPLRSDFNSFYFFPPSWFLKSLFILMSGIVMPSTHYHAPWVHFPGGFECIHRKT